MAGSFGAAQKVFNIPAGEDFSRILAAALLDETRDAPENLTRYKILLPTRRACRVLRDSFLDLSDGKPVLLPQMNPVGDVDEDDLSLLMFGGRGELLDVPPSMLPLRRQIMLARIIMKVPDFAQGFDHALVLAQALAQLMDKAATEELDLADLHKIVPHEFAGHWQITLKFLEIISAHWPQVLSENNVIDGAGRRNILLRALAQHWEDTRPDCPIIAAGSTGSIPATGHLLDVIAGLPQGRIILPGLDMHIDQESWDVLEESHPQYGLKKLLQRIRVDRSDVVIMGADSSGRTRLASEIMRPAQTTQYWREFTAQHDVQAQLAGLRYYDCKTQQEEAQLIALMIREKLQEQRATIALISPDRSLARRVIAMCRRWGIEADDSAGESLAESRIGRFMVLGVGAVSRGFNAANLLAFLKHTLCHAGMANDVYRKRLRDLEKEILRSRDAVFGFAQMIDRAAAKQEDLGRFCARIYEGLAPFLEIAAQGMHVSFMQILKAHIAMLEGFAAMESETGEDVLWRGEDGEAASLFLIDVMHHAGEIGDVTITEYEKILQQLMGQVSVRTPYGVHPRLTVLGQLEARLTSADLIIMAGLSEGSWPSAEKHDPWMSHKMRKDFGLPTDEKGIGLAAHDFVQAFCAKNVVMTRSQIVDSAPCVPARWLQRLDTVLKSAGTSLAQLGQDSALHWARSLDSVAQVKAYGRPHPCPPLSVRPQRVSVTKIENWLSDPYSIYAYYVLRLRKLDPLTKTLDAALRGTILHEILDRFIAQNPLYIPDNAMEIMAECAHDVLIKQGVAQEDLNFWWPKFTRIAQWFIDHEIKWRENAKFEKAELEGKISLDVDGREFVINGRVDRIDRMHGGYAIIDYKTGNKYTAAALRKGVLPQLPIEAMMIRRGGFAELQVVDTQYLGYWKMTGGRDAGSEDGIYGEDVDNAVQIVEEGLMALLREFQDPSTPFHCVPDMNNAPAYNDFEHLSRLKEWVVLDESLFGEGGEA